MTTALTAEVWADALELYRFSYASVAVVRREHEEWWLDAASIMSRRASDPRGWLSLDPDEDEPERRDDPLFPFAQAPRTLAEAARFRAGVRELPRSSVSSLLVLLGIPGLDATRAPDFDRDRPGMERRARLLLSRFADGTRFYSNIGWEGDRPDFCAQPVRMTHPLSRYGWDAGLIAVNDCELALFRHFDPT
ncbi:hypothetical protein [Streptomyces yangpuensis]|uniref:hypothetical protein n=1 Tax=Streptomyces yangpuensis TaxID=1648182 RepID=UPI003658D0B0